MMNLCIAGMPVEVESGDKAYFAQRYAAYVSSQKQPPQLRMTTTLVDPVPQPAGELIQQIKNVDIYRTPEGRFCRCVRSAQGQILYTVCYTADYAQADIRLLSSRKNPYFTQTDWEYMHTGYCFNNRLSYLGGGILHSSSLAYKGQGVAFTANSGTGKSTHVGLWKQRFGEDVRIINDDKPAIYFDGKQPILCGTPWSGKTALNLNEQVPLRAIVVVERGKVNRMRRLDAVESMYHLASQISRPYFDEALGLKILDFTERLMESVPIYALTCDISQQAVETAFREIFPQEA